MILLIDGKNDKIQITAFGQMFEMSKTDGITITDGSAASIRIKDGVVALLGQVCLGGMIPFQPVIAGPSSVAGVPAAGVFVGV